MDWIAGAFELVGLYIVGNKNKYGFAISIVGNLVWVYIAFVTKLYGLILVCIPAVIINIINFIKWSKGKGDRA